VCKGRGALGTVPRGTGPLPGTVQLARRAAFVLRMAGTEAERNQYGGKLAAMLSLPLTHYEHRSAYFPRSECICLP